MSKHTPGPWEIRYGNVSDADEGFGIAGTLDGQTHMVAECWPCSTDIDRRMQLRADARLIAAAPDLLAACEAMLDDTTKCDEVMRMIRAAIAKAKEARP
jgi:hypothetical protein